MNPGTQTTTLGTEQETFWVRDFGDDYITRNASPQHLTSNIALFSRVLARTGPLTSFLELGSNIGLNLRALRTLLPTAALSAVEINAKAAATLREWGDVANVFETSLLTFEPKEQYDLTFTKGVLIHVAPADLHRAYEVLYRASRRYILVAEYYNPVPMTITYRGVDDRLFKRDFAGDLLDMYPSLSLIDYGFCYRRDPVFPQDDISWFLMAK